METFRSVVNYIGDLFETNGATLSGANDIIVVEHSNGRLKSTVFHVRFGRCRVAFTSDKQIQIFVNGKNTGIKMRLGPEGEGYFDKEDFEPKDMAKSPPVTPADQVFVKSFSDSLSASHFCQKSISLGHGIGPNGEFSMEEFKRTEVSWKDFEQNPMVFLERKGFCIKFNGEIFNGESMKPKIEQMLEENNFKLQNFLSILTNESQEASSAKGKQDKNKHFQFMDSMSYKNSNKFLQLPHQFLKIMNLKRGENKITYRLFKKATKTSPEQLIFDVVASIFLYSSKSKLVFSDIDGTVTKSDVMGHLLPKFGHHWAQPDIAELYTSIWKNGYHVAYLTARPIGQSESTKNYLKWVDQSGHKLPTGPVFCSPDITFRSFKREVIDRSPEMFKIICLLDIKQAFGFNQPFFAGFGNRNADVVSYMSKMIEAHKVFLINPQGVIKIVHDHYAKEKAETVVSYKELNRKIDEHFPVFSEATSTEGLLNKI